MTTFADLKLSEKSLHALHRAGFEHPTPIQTRAIPPALAGKDVVGVAATGTGKTAAFLLPILERLAAQPGRGPRALVLAPTRELAVQIHEQLERFAAGRHVRGALVIGGVGMAAQAQALRECTVIVATPGRLVDQLQQGNARLDGIEVLVLDEADRMLDMGFRPQLTRILAMVPTARQTLFFSATMGDEVSALARSHLRDPVRVEVTRTGTTAPRAIQHVFLPGQHEKIALLLALLDHDELSTLVFTRTKRRADRVAKTLQRAGHKVARIHADRTQAQRRMALEGFRDGQYRILVATDIAARGIDVAEIGHVVNFDLPHVAEDYVHRVGRTARASASGRASSFASPEELPLLRDIERLTRAEIPRKEVPRGSEVFQAELKRAAAAQADSGPGAKPTGMNRNRRRAAAHNSRRAAEGRPAHTHAAEAHAHASHAPSANRHAAPGSHAPSDGDARPKARHMGSWGPRRRR